MNPLVAVVLASTLLRMVPDGQIVPECWSFTSASAGSRQPVFPTVRLSPGGAVLLHDGSGTATWGARGDTIVVTSGPGSQTWTLAIRSGPGVPTATLIHGTTDPHGVEAPIDLRPRPLSCETIDWSAPDAPVDAPPRIANLDEVDAAMRRESPGTFGVTRSALVRFKVDVHGRVLERAIEQTAGDALLDEAAFRIGEAPRFEPARRGGKPVEAWTALWFHFR